MTKPIDGVYFFSPAFAILCTGALAAPATPTVQLVSASGSGFAVKPSYKVVAFLDGGRIFQSDASGAGAWSGSSATGPRVLVSWAPVPYARAYGVWRTYTDSNSAQSTRMIYFGSGRNIFSGAPQTNAPAQFWGQDFALFDQITNEATADSSFAMGKPIAVPSATACARSAYVLRDLRRLAVAVPWYTPPTPAASAVVLANEIEHEDSSDNPGENVNQQLAGFKQGIRHRFTMLFQFDWGSDQEKALIDIFNAEQARSDDMTDSSIAGLQLFATMSLDRRGGPNLQNDWNPIQQWGPVRIVAPKIFPKRPSSGDALMRGEIPITFELDDPSFTLPYPEEWEVGLPLYR